MIAYHILDSCEDVQPGDEYWHPTLHTWFPINPLYISGFGYKPCSDRVYRRKINAVVDTVTTTTTSHRKVTVQ